MKKKKFIGMTLIAAAILLQVGYATTTGQTMNTVNVGEFKVNFENTQVINEDPYIKVNVPTEPSTGSVSIDVANLYPGARFGVETIVKNSGALDVTITKIEVMQTSKNYSELYNHLIGYIGDKPIEDYNDYLQEEYLGKVVKTNTSFPVVLEMGLSPEVTDLKNEFVKFDLRIEFGQEEPNPEPNPDPNPDEGDGNPPDTEIETPDTDIPEETIPGGGVNTPEESIPGGAIDVPEESIPGGAVDIPEESIPGGTIEIQEETIPGGGLLPQTGGITPALVYGMGIALLGSGIVLYRKKDDE